MTNKFEAVPTSHAGTDYMNFLPWLARASDITRYLEIGVNMGHLLQRVHVRQAVGVDPAFVINANVSEGKESLYLFQQTSDRFFQEQKEFLGRFKPELVFLDGMHLFEYLLRDFINAEKTCLASSLIVMHDCLPLSPEMCHRSQDISRDLTRDTPFYGWWTGDVWKIVPILKKYRPDLKVVCLDAAPTGLVCVSGLDPKSTILNDNYLEIVEQHGSITNDMNALGSLYQDIEIVNASEMIEGNSHGLFFRR